MKKPRILIISADLEIGGIERSLIGLLESIDYDRYEVDLLLYRLQGAFMQFLPRGPRLLPAIPEYTTFQRSILQVLREGHVMIALALLKARFSAALDGRRRGIAETVYLYVQRSWRFASPYLPEIPGCYDLAISFVGPHYPVNERVQARMKLGWIHTDYHTIPIDEPYESVMWGRLDQIAAVSDECRVAFLHRFPQLKDKTMVIENILSPNFIRRQAEEYDGTAEMKPRTGLTRLLSVGRFSHAKGIDLAVLACRRLLDAGCDVCWYVVGYGGDEELIRRLITENRLEDRFILLGKQVNPYPYMRACDLFVQPSRYEGKAVTVREAQILGKAVMVTRFPTAASQVEDGVDGHICELGVEGIVAGIKFLLMNEEYRKGLAACALSRDYGNKEEVNKIFALLNQRKS